MELNQPAVKNNQWPVFRIMMVLSIISFVIMVMPTIEDSCLGGLWFLTILGLFLGIVFFISALIFRNRARKMDRLLNNDRLIGHWKLSNEMIAQYAGNIRKEGYKRANFIMGLIAVMFVIIVIPFLFFLDEDEMPTFLIIIGSVLAIVFIASRYFPWHYYRRNLKGDGQILIGDKYAYFNGYFHNWDYPLSGLLQIKTVKKPYRGLYIKYYYTDRTLVHHQEITIPLPEDYDPSPLIDKLKDMNGL